MSSPDTWQPVYASEDDITAVLAAIDERLKIDGEMPPASEHGDPYLNEFDKVDLIPVSGLKALAVKRREGLPDDAVVTREVFRPDIGPSAWQLESYVTFSRDGQLVMEQSLTSCPEGHLEAISLDALSEGDELAMSTGENRPTQARCKELAAQILASRVSLIKSDPSSNE